MSVKTIGLILGGLAAAGAAGGVVYAATRKRSRLTPLFFGAGGRIVMPPRIVLDRYQFANYTYGVRENPSFFLETREVTNWDIASAFALSGISKYYPQGQDTELPGMFEQLPDLTFSVRNKPRSRDETAGGVNFYVEAKDFWPIVIKFRPRWFASRMYDRVFNPRDGQVGTSGQNLRWRMAGLGTVKPDGQVVSRINNSPDWDDNSFGNGTYVDRDVLFYQWIQGIRDYTGLSTSGGLAHPYFHLPYYYLDSKYGHDYFEKIGEYQSKIVSMEMNYGSGYPYTANMLFIKAMLAMAFPKMHLYDWCIVSNGQGVDSEHHPVLDHDSLHSYFIAMCAKQRTLTVAGIFKWIFDIATFVYDICSGSIMSAASSSQEALASSAVIQESAEGCIFLQGLKKVEIVLNNNRLPQLEQYFRIPVPADRLTIMDLIPDICQQELGQSCVRINQPLDLKAASSKTLRRRT